MPVPENKRPELSDTEIVRYLKAHPAFLHEHPELLARLVPPEQQLGDGVVDFQRYAVTSLQKNLHDAQAHYQRVIDSARENLSVQGQVHGAVLAVVAARDLEQLLEAIALDLPALFEVDVVRLAMESQAAGSYDTYYGEQNYSGVAFIDPGLAAVALGREKTVRLVADTEAQAVSGIEQVFEDCLGLVRSCALLKLELPRNGKHALLAFGVREPGRFKTGQGVELLSFLARVVERRLDHVLSDAGILP